MSERDVLDKYSTAGLRRHELSYSAKKAHLRELRLYEGDVQKVLVQLYPSSNCWTSCSARPHPHVTPSRPSPTTSRRSNASPAATSLIAASRHSAPCSSTRRSGGG